MALTALALACCGGDDGGTSDSSASMSASSTAPTVTDTTPTGSETSVGTTTTDTGTTSGFKFDLPSGEDETGTEGMPSCKVVDDMDAVGACRMQSPPDSFEPDVQWSWPAQVGSQLTIVNALAANLTDDNDDGEIDLCDIPDVVIVAGTGLDNGRIFVLDGATGAEHFSIQVDVAMSVTPALGDIDNDGLPEIISATPGGLFHGSQPSNLVAFEHDGAMKWQNNSPINHGQGFAVALADIDHDGDVEIIADDVVTDHNGITEWVAPDQVGWSPYDIWHCTATAVADLDDDTELEIILGQSAYHADGSQYYLDGSIEPGFPQVANLDADPQPEVLITNRQGITILEHTGAIKVFNQTPTGDGYPSWFRPATVHDFDGDDTSEFAVSSASHYSVFEPDLAITWTADVQDLSGWASGTAFDFLGDGVADAMYADENTMFVFDGTGTPLLQVPRGSPTLIEYPIVVDVDNDGSAEIVVMSYDQGFPALQVIRDIQDRWIQARRIWNQHTYHVTNVREDGTIPQFETPSWTLLNTYRTNAQIEGGVLCKPDPEG